MSFIEVIVVLFIVIVLFDISLMEVNALSIMRKQRYENVAYHIANKEMEGLRATAFASLPSSGTISDPLLSQIPSGSGNFTVSDYSGYSGLKEEMEGLRATAFASLPSSGTISDPLLSQIPSGSGNFTVSDYSGYSGIKELITTVAWNDGSSKSVVIKTLAGNGG